MARRVKNMKGAMLAAFLVGMFLGPVLCQAEPVLVQTTGSQGFVRVFYPGPFDPDRIIRFPFIFADAVLIHVLVTNPLDGTPIDNLGASVGDWSSAISLPPGWTLQSLAGPSYCSALSPTRFENLGNGVYRIYVVLRGWFFCLGWRAGDYVYRIEINNAGGTTFRGSGMGLFEIKSP